MKRIAIQRFSSAVMLDEDGNLMAEARSKGIGEEIAYALTEKLLEAADTIPGGYEHAVAPDCKCLIKALAGLVVQIEPDTKYGAKGLRVHAWMNGASLDLQYRTEKTSNMLSALAGALDLMGIKP